MNHPIRGDRFVGLAIVLCVVLPGCSGDLPDIAPVSGTISLDGEPLTEGAVVIFPPQGRMGRGHIQADGSFVISTFDDGDGARVGPVQIAVFGFTRAGGPRSEAPKEWFIPEKFGSADSSGLECDITAGKDNVLTIELSSDGTGEVKKVD